MGDDNTLGPRLQRGAARRLVSDVVVNRALEDLGRSGGLADSELVTTAVLRARSDIVFEELHVDSAWSLGWSWQAIAEALGMTRRSVHKSITSGARRGR